MSRSYRKHPFYDGGSKKWGKEYSSRLLRHKSKQIMESISVDLTWEDQEGSHSEPRRMGCPSIVNVSDFLMPEANELYDFWWDNDSGCNFDPLKYPKLLRK